MHHQTRCLIVKPPGRQDVKRNNTCHPATLALLLLFLACANQKPAVDVSLIDDRAIAALPSKHKTVVINFWATWCGPCVEEIPMLVKFHNQHKDLAIIGISMDEPKDQPRVQQFLKDHSVSYQVFLRKGGEGFEAMVNSMDANWIGAIPATFVFTNGKRTFSKTGELDASDLKTILKHAS
jgi:thiol-disulfide isomerase/thioredoxin